MNSISLAYSLRARLHQASASTLRQLCDEASDSMEMFENGLQTNSGASPQSCRSVDADVWCKRVLTKKQWK